MMKHSAINISVVIPCFNGSKYLTRCVNSILNQSKAVYEIIVVDDCSTDASRNIIHQMRCSNSKIKARFLEKNRGVSHARNEGIDYATGDYITFVDVDDVLPANAVEHYIKAIGAYPGLNLYQGLQSKADQCTEGSAKLLEAILLRKICLGYPRSKSQNSELAMNIADSVHGCYGKCYDLHVVKSSNIRFRENIGLGEDLLFYYEMLQISDWVCVLDAWVYEIIYEYGSATRSFNPNMPKYTITFSHELMEIEESNALQDDVSYQINQHVNKAIGCYFDHPGNRDHLITRARKLLNDKSVHKAYRILVKSRYSTGVRKLKYCLLRDRFAFAYLLIEKLSGHVSHSDK